MRVHKTTKVEVGDGTSSAIINALMEAGLPPEARATSIEADYSRIFTDILLDSAKIFSTPILITFEWDVEE